jgi:hypothetical protein
VDHLPASSTVPTPLKFFGRIVGTPGELTYAKDIHRYFEALDRASPRVAVRTLGRTTLGRPFIAAFIADSATIAELPRYRELQRRLADPRLLAEAADGADADAAGGGSGAGADVGA